MEPVSEVEFIADVGRTGIAFDARYPNADRLRFSPDVGESRFWVVPDDQADWPDFVSSILFGLDQWTEALLWPRLGRWLANDNLFAGSKASRIYPLKEAGVPDRWHGAIRVAESERNTAATVLRAYLLHGGCVDEDLYFIPGHGRQIVMASHHDVVHVDCLDLDRMLMFADAMAEAGYELPTYPPDETFIWPDWMERPDSSGQ